MEDTDGGSSLHAMPWNPLPGSKLKDPRETQNRCSLTSAAPAGVGGIDDKRSSSLRDSTFGFSVRVYSHSLSCEGVCSKVAEAWNQSSTSPLPGERLTIKKTSLGAGSVHTFSPRVHLRSLTNNEDADLLLSTRFPLAYFGHDSDGASEEAIVSPACKVTSRQNLCTLRDGVSQDKERGTRHAVFRFHNYFTSHLRGYCTPMPHLAWADPQEVWSAMMKKDAVSFSQRNCSAVSGYPSVQARMRAILLDWIIEVCELYRLHRETFYLAADFIDRYLSVHRNVQRMQLQLIGVTALFVAAKIEEICPPKLADFTYVTDGACLEREVVNEELVLLKALKWDLNPITINTWLTTHLHALSMRAASRYQGTPHALATDAGAQLTSPYSYVQIARLLDLCLLDAACLQFSYSVLSAAALYHISDADVATMASGYAWDDIEKCVSWMTPFAVTLREEGNINVKFFDSVPPEDTHNIQTRSVDLHLLERAQQRMVQGLQASRQSPDLTRQLQLASCLLTPPHSNQKIDS